MYKGNRVRYISLSGIWRGLRKRNMNDNATTIWHQMCQGKEERVLKHNKKDDNAR